jgi:FecR protein
MRKMIILVAALLMAAGSVLAQEPPAQQAQTPPPPSPQDQKDVKYTNDSIARLSFIQGKAFVQRASDLGYEEAALNMPISQGDRIGTSDGRVEVHFGRGNYVRLDGETKVDILNLPKKDDDIARFRVWSGNIFLVVGTLRKEKGIELHTADSSFYVLDKGVYRVGVRENKDTEILVYQGLIEVAGEDGSSLLKAAQRLDIAEGRFASKPSSFIPVSDDAFDKFNESRTAVTGREFAQSRLPEELADFEGELEEYGEWQYLAPYGNVWVPNGVEEDWRPYYDGRWTWLPLSGWTWWPYEPWGWSTFHYGRWHWGVGLGWYWIPMNTWGPAWVDWWWDDFYFGWAPLSYWGYPGVFYGGAYYGHYYGPYYPAGSRAMTVVRRDALKDPHIARTALRGDALRSVNNKITMTGKSPKAGHAPQRRIDGIGEGRHPGPRRERRDERAAGGPPALQSRAGLREGRRNGRQAPEREEPVLRQERIGRRRQGFGRIEQGHRQEEGRRPLGQ